MNKEQIDRGLNLIVESLELPDSAYEKAKARYEDLAKWLSRDDSECRIYDPHIFSQGSFRLGTAIYPVDEKAPYDLDLACELMAGIHPKSHTQIQLKTLVGKEVEKYRLYRAISAPKEEKHRCWRLHYADTLSFYMDIVPCIPAHESKRSEIMQYLRKIGENDILSEEVSRLTVNITDDRHPSYPHIDENWLVSNPEGYARWFESRAKLAMQFLESRMKLLEAASIDELPSFMWKTPLQRCVQILKRHRDQMFKDNYKVKPASILITTLAARSYNGEGNVYAAMENILSRMGQFVNSEYPRVPNPVNPKRMNGGEDFADKWIENPELETRFWEWIERAQLDFSRLGSIDNLEDWSSHIQNKFTSRLSLQGLQAVASLLNNRKEDATSSGPIIVNSRPSGRHLKW